VNGHRVRSQLAPGFFPLRKQWKTGDKIELEIDQSLRYEPVDAQNSSQVALLRGPQVMFALADKQPRLSRRVFSSARIEKVHGDDWVARTETGDIRLRPFGSIGDEVYQTYWEVTG